MKAISDSVHRVALREKADIGKKRFNVRYRHKADILVVPIDS